MDLGKYIEAIIQYFAASPEAIATLIGIALTAIGAAISLSIKLLRRDLPRRVLIDTVMDIHPFAPFASPAEDESDQSQSRKNYLFIEYPDGKEVMINDFWFQQIAIYNIGRQDILEEFDLTLFPINRSEKPRYWECTLDGDASFDFVTVTMAQGETRAIHIHFPYLNSYTIHNNQVVLLNIFSDCHFELRALEKGGKGWSIAYGDRKADSPPINSDHILIAIVFLLVTVSVAFSFLVGYYYLSLDRMIVSGVFLLVLFLAFMSYLLYVYYRIYSFVTRPKRPQIKTY